MGGWVDGWRWPLSIKQPSPYNKQSLWRIWFYQVILKYQYGIGLYPQKLERRQVLVNNIGEAVARFEQANFLDCRIGAYHGYTKWGEINRRPPDLIFIYVVLSRFNSNKWVTRSSREAQALLDRAVNKTLKNIKDNLDGDGCAHPTVIWSGNG